MEDLSFCSDASAYKTTNTLGKCSKSVPRGIFLTTTQDILLMCVCLYSISKAKRLNGIHVAILLTKTGGKVCFGGYTNP